MHHIHTRQQPTTKRREQTVLQQFTTHLVDDVVVDIVAESSHHLLIHEKQKLYAILIEQHRSLVCKAYTYAFLKLSKTCIQQMRVGHRYSKCLTFHILL